VGVSGQLQPRRRLRDSGTKLVTTDQTTLARVKTRLAAYEYPRQVEFIEEMPLTTTGKIRRTELRAMHQTKVNSR
jgi:acetyl-CoA synthetase